MFRFTIRDVLWLTVVVGMGVGWLAERAFLRRQMAAIEATLQGRINEKVQELAAIEAVIRDPQPGENTLHTVNDILRKRSLPKAVFMSRPGTVNDP
jgi:hypothetical protein